MTAEAKVLIVEDDDIIIFSNQMMLENLGVASDVVMNVEEAVHKMLSVRYDLVLLDLGLGDDKLAGFEILKQVRAAEDPENRLPIIVLTARTESNIADEAIRLGANHFISKTIDHDGLCVVVKKYLSNTAVKA